MFDDYCFEAVFGFQYLAYIFSENLDKKEKVRKIVAMNRIVALP